MNFGDIFYVKEALGKDGVPIKVYKLRTMTAGSAPDCERNVYGKPLEDPRITPIGTFLRRYWIDEVPQLYNLAIGDLKLVGIRPMSEDSWAVRPPALRERVLRHKPGLMGIHYAYTDGDFEDHVRIIEQYLDDKENMPYLTDFRYFGKILFNILFLGVRSS